MKKLFVLLFAAATVFQLFAASFKEVNTLMKEKKWDEAEKSCRQLIAEVKNPKDRYYAYQKLMMIMRRQKKNAELVKDAEEFILSCQDNLQKANLLIYKGLGLRDSKQRVEALEAFRQAVDEAKDGKVAREAAYYYIEIAGSLKKTAEVKSMYSRAEKFAGADKDVSLMLAASFAFWDNNMCAESLAVLDKIDAVEGLAARYKSESYRYRGNVMHLTKKYEDAIKYFDLARQNTTADYNIGRIDWSKAKSYEAMGNKEKALEMYKKAASYKGDAAFQRMSAAAVKRLSK